MQPFFSSINSQPSHKTAEKDDRSPHLSPRPNSPSVVHLHHQLTRSVLSTTMATIPQPHAQDPPVQAPHTVADAHPPPADPTFHGIPFNIDARKTTFKLTMTGSNMSQVWFKDIEEVDDHSADSVTDGLVRLPPSSQLNIFLQASPGCCVHTWEDAHNHPQHLRCLRDACHRGLQETG